MRGTARGRMAAESSGGLLCCYNFRCSDYAVRDFFSNFDVGIGGAPLPLSYYIWSVTYDFTIYYESIRTPARTY